MFSFFVNIDRKLGNAKMVELDGHRIEARALSSRKASVEKRISEIDKDISDVREQLKDLESDFSNRNHASLQSELRSQIEQLRRDIEEASAKVQLRCLETIHPDTLLNKVNSRVGLGVRLRSLRFSGP